MNASSPAYSADSVQPARRAVPLLAIVLLALAVHAPLLMMELPNSSYDANFHMFFAAHYAEHWFNPWNEKWFAGFSQTTYPPLQHQWIAIFSKVMSLNMAYSFVQLIAILLMPIGMYRYARLWVDERTSSYAAVGSVLLGSLSFLVYQSGQLSTTMAAPLYLNALPYFYDWIAKSRGRAFIKGVVLCLAAAAAHHVTLLFGAVLFALPVLWLALIDRKQEGGASVAGVLSRAALFAAISAVGVGAVLLPYFIALIHNPIKQLPIPHASRANFLLHPLWGVNFFVIPYGALLLALPYIFWKGCTERRLRPLFFGFWLTFLFGLGGTTPIPRLLLGRAFEVLTFERFAFWATLMALPIAAILAAKIIDRFQTKGLVTVWVLAVASYAAALGWDVAWRPFAPQRFDVQPVISFLNRDNHNRFRYLTLGFGDLMSKVGAYADANSVDGEYNSARLLPEMTRYGSAQLTNSKYYGTAGMESLRAMLEHANKYGLKYIFVHDRYYEPLLAFAGWRPTEVYDNGLITLWTKEDVPPAKPMEFGEVPPPWQGLMWGTLPIGSSILAIIVVLLLPERKRIAEPLQFPAAAGETVYLPEAK